ncbi:hypothetical protein AK812_SmicGene29731 [Symbiodinium microadriaticum]|uniref:Uncharacterized protein n=1 Tax=Symbiodinium microadriaticum TaxID=2951 RepID=A0A1Q9D137_SYMMI|nr:hypothetical protein AK812_SmicGene29731 [Symbiodinium microadriaticum]
MNSSFNSDVPGWDGNPSTFLAFEVACKWFEKTLKETERRGAAARVWSRLSGPARSVVKHLSAEDFDCAGGLDKLLQVLRASPLQSLPIPDSFAKLEKWHQLRRRDQESIPELLVREDELFLELQQSLVRSRARERPATTLTGSPGAGATTGDGASTPASPSSAKKKEDDAEDEPATAETPAKDTGFFDNELRGFRLLKAAGITYAERQQVLTLTGNSVAFEKIPAQLLATNGTTDHEFDHDFGTNGTIDYEFYRDLCTNGTINREFFHELGTEGTINLGTNGMSDYVLRGETPVPQKTQDQATRISYTVSTAERPVFRFGDGLSLRASSKVVLHGTSLGSVSFFVLDGEHRPQTWNASKTPALIGSKYLLRESKATISYEHMRLWFLDPANQLWGTELLQTQSGHLMIPVDSDFMNLTQLRSQAEETYSIVLPPDAQSLIDVLSTPGAALELQRIQTGGAKSSSGQREPQQSAPGHVKEQEPESSVFVGTASQCQHGFHEDSPVRPPMAQRLQSLRMQLGCLALRRSAGPQQHVQFEDGRPFGRSSGQGLAVRGQAQSERHAPEPVGHVEDRGPPAHHVAMAMEELRSTIPAEDLTESIVKGKIMEIQGRKKVMGEKVKIETQMEEREPSPRRRHEREPRPTLGNPVAKTESEKEKDLEEAWLLLQDQEFKLSALKMKLEEEMRDNGKDNEEEFEKMSWIEDNHSDKGKDHE